MILLVNFSVISLSWKLGSYEMIIKMELRKADS
jgi:hypothetical protein